VRTLLKYVLPVLFAALLSGCGASLARKVRIGEEVAVRQYGTVGLDLTFDVENASRRTLRLEEAELEDVLHSILLETYSDRSFTSSDTIPLTSYSSGALYEVMVDGQLQQGGSYCNVRNAKLPPKEWHKTFGMKEYIWFELLFTGK
jgi:hypothetical protein